MPVTVSAWDHTGERPTGSFNGTTGEPDSERQLELDAPPSRLTRKVTVTGTGGRNDRLVGHLADAHGAQGLGTDRDEAPPVESIQMSRL